MEKEEMESGYAKALSVAGAHVLNYKEFGSYQGDWWAKVRYQGNVGWVTGCFGSCSGCDAFEAEFGYGESWCEVHGYSHNKDCNKCKENEAKIKLELKSFGESYLADILSQEEAEKIAAKHIKWDCEADGMLDWIKRNSIHLMMF